MSYYVSRQVYWPEGQHVVEIAPGFDHASPGQLVAHYKAQGEGDEFADPVEAAEAAILVRRAWQKDSKKRIGLTFGDADLGWGAHTQKELLAWAAKMHEKVPKCDWCGEVLGSKRGDQWRHQDFQDETFCSEHCIEKMVAEQAKLEQEFEPNSRLRAIGILGDVNYLDYGGMIVFEDGSVELVEPDDENENGPTTVYRFVLEPFNRGTLEREWFWERPNRGRSPCTVFSPPLKANTGRRLKSSTETKAVEKLVRSAAAERFGRGQAVPVFEHGQWWVDVDGALYSVVDARPGIGRTGLDFEALG